MSSSQPIYEIRPRKDHRGVDLISDALLLILKVRTEPILPALEALNASITLNEP